MYDHHVVLTGPTKLFISYPRLACETIYYIEDVEMGVKFTLPKTFACSLHVACGPICMDGSSREYAEMEVK